MVNFHTFGCFVSLCFCFCYESFPCSITHFRFCYFFLLLCQTRWIIENNRMEWWVAMSLECKSVMFLIFTKAVNIMNEWVTAAAVTAITVETNKKEWEGERTDSYELIRSKMIFAFKCTVWIELTQIRISFDFLCQQQVVLVSPICSPLMQNESATKTYNRLIHEAKCKCTQLKIECSYLRVESFVNSIEMVALIDTKKGVNPFYMFLSISLSCSLCVY